MPRISPASGSGRSAWPLSRRRERSNAWLPLPLAGEGWGRSRAFEPHAASRRSGSGLQARTRTASEGVRATTISIFK